MRIPGHAVIQFPILGWLAPWDRGQAHWFAETPKGELATLCGEMRIDADYMSMYMVPRTIARCRECSRTLATGRRLPAPLSAYLEQYAVAAVIRHYTQTDQKASGQDSTSKHQEASR